MAEHDLLIAALAERDGVRAGALLLQHDLKTRDALRAQQGGGRRGLKPPGACRVASDTRSMARRLLNESNHSGES